MTDSRQTENAAPRGTSAADCSTFQHLLLNNPIVAHIMRAGGTAEDCAVALAAHNDRLVGRLMTMEGIAPRRIKLPDGRVMVWRCPDHLIPEADMSNKAIESTPLLADEYRCAMCGGVFKKAWTDEEAKAEQEANGWGALAPEDSAVVCDNCYRQMTALYPPAEFNRDQANAKGCCLSKPND